MGSFCEALSCEITYNAGNRKEKIFVRSKECFSRVNFQFSFEIPKNLLLRINMADNAQTVVDPLISCVFFFFFLSSNSAILCK